MSRIKLGIKVLGLCALVFAVTGIASSGAQAAGTWLVLEGGTVTEGTGGELTLEKDRSEERRVGKECRARLLECPKIKIIGAKLGTAGTIQKGAKVKYSG